MWICSFLLALAFTPTDPLFAQQYSLKNTGVYGSAEGEDINVAPAWDMATGKGQTVGIIGNGCSINHQDLLGKEIEALHYNVDKGSKDIAPSATDPDPDRTINLAGLAVGAANGICTVGVAYDSNFYCMKMTNTSEAKYVTAINHAADSTQIKYFAIPAQCDSSAGTIFGECEAPKAFSQVDAAINANENVIIVTGSGVDAVSGGDSNMFPVSKHPNAITVADSTANGARSWWSNRGSSIIVNAPAGGSVAIAGESNEEPAPPSIGSDGLKCVDRVSPVGTGAAYVSGVVSMMLEKASTLKPRDIQAIFALTSTINYPQHNSWVENAAGFKYSDVFGFGRVNAELAVQASKEWTEMPVQKTSTVKFANIKLPQTRSGLKTSTVSMSSTIVFIEYVKLEFQFEEIGSLEIVLKSPSGTEGKIVVSGNVKDTTEKLVYVARNFFGEAAQGEWTIIAVRNGFGKELDVSSIVLTVVGMSEKPTLPKFQRKTGADSVAALPVHEKTELVVSPAKAVCDADMKIKIIAPETYTGKYDVFIRDENKDSIMQITGDVEINKETTVKIPCVTRTSNFTLYAENRAMKSSVSKRIDITNEKADNTIISPAAYDTLFIKDGLITFDMDVAMHWDFFTTDSVARVAIVGVYDMTRKQIVTKKPVLYSDLHQVTLSVKDTVEHAVLFLAPTWTPDYTGCSTLIQPVFILKEGEFEPVKFKIPLDNGCPVPAGINQGEFTEPNPKLRLIWVIAIGVFSVVFVITVTIWHFMCRKNIGEDYDLNKHALLTTQE